MLNFTRQFTFLTVPSVQLIAHNVKSKRVFSTVSVAEEIELEASIEGVDDILLMTGLNKPIKFYIKWGLIKSKNVHFNEYKSVYSRRVCKILIPRLMDFQAFDLDGTFFLT